MRSYRLDAGTGLDGLRLDVSDLPVPGPGEVLVEVRAASLGYREAMILEGRYVLPVRAGGIPLAEGVGVVSARGPDAAGPPVGARVIATTGHDARAGLLRELGAEVVLNYRDIPDWPAAVRAATGGHGA